MHSPRVVVLALLGLVACNEPARAPMDARRDVDSRLAPDAGASDAAAPDVAVAPARWVCVFPQRGPFSECVEHDGSLGMGGDRGYVDCLASERVRPQRQARFRLDEGPWVEVDPERWRCVPLDGAKLTIENHGRPRWTIAVTSERPCEVIDLTAHWQYGALYTECSRRGSHEKDDRVIPNSAPAATTDAAWACRSDSDCVLVCGGSGGCCPSGPPEPAAWSRAECAARAAASAARCEGVVMECPAPVPAGSPGPVRRRGLQGRPRLDALRSW